MLRIEHEWFLDKYGRCVLLRGVNLGGSSKVPFEPNGATHIETNFSDHREVSFVGRPFPLEDAQEHFSRLKHWGFNCLRFLITWEAIEHFGPNQYDKEYLEYIAELLKIAEQFKFYIFIDPHQDVWSRMSGGDGAPGWIFEKVGIDVTKLDESEAAFTMQKRYNPEDTDSYPAMSWSSNACRFANGTLWTLFFGGYDFAPSCTINGKNAQDYLQSHYINAIIQVVKEIKDYPYIIGYDTLNEPERGWIGKKVDGSGMREITDYIGCVFTPYDAMLTAAGYSRTVDYNQVKRFGIRKVGEKVLNKDQISCWLNGFPQIWKEEGIWKVDDLGNPIILNNDHFVFVDGREIDFHFDYLSPFIKTYAEKVQGIDPEAIIFFEGHPTSTMTGKALKFDLPNNVVHAGHWYDGASLITKKPFLRANYDITQDTFVIGKRNVQGMFIRQLRSIKNYMEGKYPTLIGEFGFHYDINDKKAYQKFKKKPKKAWKVHVKALNMYYNALDANLLHGTQWNYTADNNNKWGDKWNLEDLSIFSRDQQLNPTDINSGGRALRGFCRPHFLACAGEPLKMNFNLKQKDFTFQFKADNSIQKPTVIYIPKIQYPTGYKVKSDPEGISYEKKEQELKIWTEERGIITIFISET